MKHKRLWGRILVAALVMMIIVPVTTLKAQAKTRSSYYYKWSKDWSEVTAILYEVNFDDYHPMI